MSDMSFKQAKELVERMEFSEIALKKTLTNIESATNNFEKTLNEQEKILNKIPNSDKKLSIMNIAIALNIGLIFGILIGKYLI
ncbi:hypothetical protein [Arcobacter vandammei]|uniref:hypothetical protein n=1 Tax=Arcobacter vandammei TaxID=2782243 RepID=UPI0018DF2E2E|nr:hypothetical protein [Arcobacter vandammei]